tara:strand:- start:313 stop:882 length:570 start_codon:yes stop_codon:yes gene_type:complete
MIDYFQMPSWNPSRERKEIESVAFDWCSGLELNLKHFSLPLPDSGGSQLQHAIDMRQHVFTCPGSDIFILTDSDMLPFTKEQVDLGIKTITENPEFAILSAWPEPHWIDSIKLEGREVIKTADINETYSCGGMRFCRKVPGLVCPPDLVKGYDGRFCRHLWREHGMRVGYMPKVKAFHLGAHCSTLWGD